MTSAQKPTEGLENSSGTLSENRSEADRSELDSSASKEAARILPGSGEKTDKVSRDESIKDTNPSESDNDALEAVSARNSDDGETPELLPPSDAAMEDYYQLQTKLFSLTLAFTAFIFPFVWGFYSLQIALDYILGACAGIVYLRMLARNVSTLGRNKKKNSSIGRLAVFAGVMIVALRWDQLEVIPVFLGFLTYKGAIIAFVLWTSVLPEKKTA